MLIKVIEIRDSATRIDALAIEMSTRDPIQWHYLHSHGYPMDGSTIVLMRLSDQKATSDPYGWPSIVGGSRTMMVAHSWINDHFGEIDDGDVVDVEYILGETKTQKIAERKERVAR